MPSIAPSTPKHADLEHALRSGMRGEVRVDRASRGLYSTDASLYQIDPLAVVIPRDRKDIAYAVKIARGHKLPILMRGGGTSLAGQTTGRAIVIDVSKHMTDVLETNVDERWVRVQPGRVRDELNAILAPTGLHFAPETATSNRANIGGMIGNNSSGTKSIVYGKTVDHVLELDVLLPTGEELHLRPMSRQEWDRIAAQNDREGEIYHGVRDIIEANREEVARRFPKVMRRVGGYNIDEFPSEGPWNLAKLVTGSEGTLATILEAKLNLEPIPKAKAVAAVHFRELTEALRATQAIVKHGPSAVEILDDVVIRLSRENIETRRMVHWVEGEPAAVLIVEFFGDTMDEVRGKFARLFDDLRAQNLGYHYPLMEEPAIQADVWGVRASGLGLMLGMKGDAKPMAFIEDSAVPLEVLPEYITDVLGVCRSLNVPVAMYAHASVGLIHVRPILNMKLAEDVERMKQISERTFELVQKYGGSWSGEHGDGLVRSYMNRRFFGDQLYEAFREIKRLFDPDGLMNPGKVVEAPPMDHDLRMGPNYRVPPIRTHYRFRADGGFDRAVEMCTGVGACRKTLGGTMCPSYIATRDEDHSTRGRANALRLAMTGQLGPEAIAGDDLHRIFDLCLGCKACKAECPSNVDVARLKGEVMAARHATHGRPLGEQFFARSAQAARWMSGPLAPAVNWINRQDWSRGPLEALTGIDRRRPLPPFAERTFSSWFEKRGAWPASSDGATANRSAARKPRVVLFEDTYLNYHEPQIGRAAVRLLEALGYEVELARAGCCGRPLISHGFLKEAAAQGLRTLRNLDRHLAQGKPLVVCEPSCLSALVDDLPDLIDDVQLGERIRAGVMMIDVFLEREVREGRIEESALTGAACAIDASDAHDTNNAGGERDNGGNADGLPAGEILIHGHCHQKALVGTAAMKALLGRTGADVSEIPSGCCGMAGSFGYERDHYDVSMKVGEDRLFPAVRSMPAGADLVACGFSCRHQIKDALGARARHWVEVMADRVCGPEAPSAPHGRMAARAELDFAASPEGREQSTVSSARR